MTTSAYSTCFKSAPVQRIDGLGYTSVNVNETIWRYTNVYIIIIIINSLLSHWLILCTFIFTLAASSGKRNVTVSPSVGLSVAHTQRDILGGSTWRGQRTILSEYYDDRNTWIHFILWSNTLFLTSHYKAMMTITFRGILCLYCVDIVYYPMLLLLISACHYKLLIGICMPLAFMFNESTANERLLT